MTYEEYFKTSGAGFNLKIGGIMRVNDGLRLGAYYHSPTYYKLTDQYYSSMSSTFDFNKGRPDELVYPEKGGTFSYKLNTPSRIGVNAAVIIQQLMVIGLDYEVVNYRNGFLKSSTVSDFAAVNDLIGKKYTTGHNIKAGLEVNFDPFKIRGGYSMNGSPFGDVASGDLVRNTVSLGAGYRTKNNFYFDIVWARTFSKEEYYLFNTLNTKADLNISTGMLGLTVGIKF
jgi:long-subunit fatty acid transport protein